MALSFIIKPLVYRKHKRLYNSLKTDKKLTVDIEFEGDILKEEYFDEYDDIYTEIPQATIYVESKT